MKPKIYILASCRIHRPFNCDNNHKTGYFAEYDTLGTLWSNQHFFGSIFCSSYIKQVIQSLIMRTNKEHIVSIFPCESEFKSLCDAFYESEIIIVEIATMKTIIQENKNLYLSHQHVDKISDPYDTQLLTEEELANNIMDIQTMIHTINKKVLFVSHFQGVIPVQNRRSIIRCLEKHATHFFNPSLSIAENEDKYIADKAHYTKEGECHIMDELHKKIIQMMNT